MPQNPLASGKLASQTPIHCRQLILFVFFMLVFLFRGIPFQIDIKVTLIFYIFCMFKFVNVWNLCLPWTWQNLSKCSVLWSVSCSSQLIYCRNLDCYYSFDACKHLYVYFFQKCIALKLLLVSFCRPGVALCKWRYIKTPRTNLLVHLFLRWHVSPRI